MKPTPLQLEWNTTLGAATSSDVEGKKLIVPKQLTNEEKTFNYAMSGAGLLLLVVVAVIAKGLHSWKYRHRSTVPFTMGPTTSKEAWSGRKMDKAAMDAVDTQTVKFENSKPSNGQLTVPKPSFPHQMATLKIQETLDEEIHPSSAIPTIGTSVLMDNDVDKVSNNIDNYLTNIESQLPPPSAKTRFSTPEQRHNQ